MFTSTSVTMINDQIPCIWSLVYCIVWTSRSNLTSACCSEELICPSLVSVSRMDRFSSSCLLVTVEMPSERFVCCELESDVDSRDELICCNFVSTSATVFLSSWVCASMPILIRLSWFTICRMAWTSTKNVALDGTGRRHHTAQATVDGIWFSQ